MSIRGASRGKRVMNPDKSSGTYIHLNAAQISGLNEMLKSGLWGNSIPDVIKRIIDEKLIAINQTAYDFNRNTE